MRLRWFAVVVVSGLRLAACSGAATVTAVLLFAGCGGDDSPGIASSASPESTGSPPALAATTPTADGSGPTPTLTSEEYSKRLSDLSKTEEFKAASERYSACLIAAGYVRVEGKVQLKDGTLLDLTRGITITPAVAEYYGAREACEEESGIAGLRRANGVANPTPDAARTSQANQQTLVMMDCMKKRGWEFREPKRVFGGLLIADPVIPAGQQDAYDVDFKACAQ